MTKDLPSPELLRKLLRYEPDTGKLFWRERPRAAFDSDRIFKCWNSRHAGKEAFLINNGKGYLTGTIFYKTYKAHRVAWALHYGRWPQEQIDHINGDRSDNTIKNLRDVRRKVNMRNQKRRSTNKSGCAGVMQRSNGKWRAMIWHNGKTKHLGTFDSFNCAASVRAKAEAELGYTKRHGKDFTPAPPKPTQDTMDL